MAKTINVLIVEDMPADGEIMVHELRRHGFMPEWRCVDNPEDYVAALTSSLDVILADYTLPAFSGMRALSLMKERGLDIPFIIVSGAVGEDVAVETMQAGAMDYLLKDRLARLGLAVERAIQDRLIRSEKRLVEEALRQSEERYRTLAESARDVIFTCDRDGRTVYLNSFASSMLGLSPKDAIGKTVAQLFPADVARQQMALLQQVIDTSKPGSAEIAIPVGDETRWFDAQLTPLFNSAGEAPETVLGIVRDITERKRSEAELIKLHQAVESSGEVIFLTDDDGIFTYVNPMFTNLYGYAAAEVVGHATPRILKSGVTNRQDYEAFWKTLLSGQIVRGELVNKTKDGRLIDVESSANPILDDGGNIVGFLGAQRDITERKRTVAALLTREAYLQAIMNNVPYLMWLKDREGRYLAVNHPFARSCGRETAEEVIGKTDLDVWPADLANKYRSEDAEVMAMRTQKKIEEPVAEPDGIKWFETFKTSILDANGEVIGTTGVSQDITNRRVAEESRRLQSAALYATADAIVITDRTGAIEWVNPAFAGLTGYTAEEARGKNPRDLVKSGKHAPAFYKDLWETILAGRTWRGDTINRRKDGRLYTDRQAITPILDATGTITHFVAIKKDISEHLQLEAQFRQAQKMESVGQLASGIAHDFNNLLTVITGTAELVLDQVSQDDQVHADVQEIFKAGERAAMLTHQLLAFSRQQILESRVLSLDTVVAGMGSLLRRLLGEDIDLVIVPTPGLGSVKADLGQIEQVITNLAVNARDAMPQGGRLTIETENVTIDENYGRQHGVAVPLGSYVLLVVSDSGSGMDEATRARIFEPFFTTKGPGKGTGLGLSTVYGIVKQSHGFIWVYSEVGQGTTFKIYLPQVIEAAGSDQPRPAVVSSSGTETILLAEDNAGLRALATRVLEPAGYTVLGAATGEEALRLLEGHEERVHLLLSDVVMPGMSGRHLAERLAQTHPGMKVLYMSGYTSDTIVQHGVLEAQVAFLNKPFTAAALLRKVREVLDS